MNVELQKHARDTLKKDLNLLPENWQLIFKRMYSPNNLGRSIEEAIDSMPEDKLDWAMTQVKNSLTKLNVDD